MRVLHVISGIDPENGGPPAALLGMCAAQQRAGMEVTVATTWQRPHVPAVAERWREVGFPVELIGPARGRLSRHPALAAVLQTLIARHDVVHVHAVWEEIQHRAARIAQDLGVPYIMTPHGMLDPWNMSRGGFTKWLYLTVRMARNFRRASAIHFATDIERRAVDRFHFGAPAIVEPFGVDVAQFQHPPPSGAFRREWQQQLAEDGLVILYLGRLHPGKGLELLVPAFAAVANVVPNAVLVIAGPDTSGYRTCVEQMIDAGKIADRVVFTGILQGDERIAALLEADLLALPSFHENFGMVVAEALAAGTPVLVSDQVNLHPEITSAGVGVVVRTDVRSVAEALRRWLTDHPARLAAAERAKPFAREHFDRDRIGVRWGLHYARVIASSGNGGTGL